MLGTLIGGDAMKTGFVSGLVVAGLVCLGMAAPQLAAAVPSPAGLGTGAEAVTPLVTPVKKWNRGRYKGKNWSGKKHIYAGPRRGYVRGWYRRPYYGRIVAGVALGAIIIASTVPRAPSSELCWYWTNSSQTRGYWDYCY